MDVNDTKKEAAKPSASVVETNLNPESITLDDLRLEARTGHSIASVLGEERDVSFKYYVSCPAGNVEYKKWCELVQIVAKRDLGEDFFNAMRLTIENHGLKYERSSEDTIERTVCEIISKRDYKKPNWLYRPHFEKYYGRSIK